MSLFSRSVMELWAAIIVLKILIAALALWKRQYPFFTAWASFSAVLSLALWIGASSGCRAYLLIGGVGGIVETVLLFGVVAEIAGLLFKPRHILPDSIQKEMSWSLTFVICCSLISPLLFPNKDLHFVQQLFRDFDRVSSLFFLGRLLAIAGFSLYLHIPWRRRARAIWVGMTLYFATATAVWLYLPGGRLERSQWAILVAFLIAQAVWLVGFIRPETSLFNVGPNEERVLKEVAEDAGPWAERLLSGN